MLKFLVVLLIVFGAACGTMKVAKSLNDAAPHRVDRDARVKKMGSTKRIPRFQKGWTYGQPLEEGVIVKEEVKKNFAYTMYLVSYEISLVNEDRELECRAKIPMWITVKCYSDGEPKDLALVKATKDYFRKLNEPYKLEINSKEPEMLEILFKMSEIEIDKFTPKMDNLFKALGYKQPTKPYTFDHVK